MNLDRKYNSGWYVDDTQASKDPSPFSSCVVVMVEIFAAKAMEAVEQQGSAMAAWMDTSCPLAPHSFL
jgi:hypothetical protein